MTLKINKDLLPFKLLYFFRAGGSAFIPVLAPIIRQKGLTAEGVGLIWTIAPVTSAAFNLISGRTADAYKVHRALLILTCTLLGLFLTCFFFLPNISVPSSVNLSGPMSEQCNSSTILTVMCLNGDLSNMSSSKNNDIVLSHGFNKSSVFESRNICLKNCSLMTIPQNDASETQESSNMISSSATERSYVGEANEIHCGHSCLKGNISVAKEDYLSVTIQNKECMSKCEDICNICGKHITPQEISLVFFLTNVEFWMILLFVLIIHSTIHASGTLADTLCSVVLGKDRHKFGRQRLFGAMGIGIMALIGGMLVNYFSKGQKDPNYIPAIIITSTFMTVCIFITTRIHVDVPGKQAQDASISDVVCSFRFIFLMVTIFIVGSSFGVMATFEFLYIEDTALKWDPDFSDTKLLQGLILFVDRFIGNVAFLFLSSYIIKRLTPLHTFTLTLSALSLRLLLASIVSNPWTFLLVHLLHGLYFGVFTTNMVASASLLAPKGAQATMQSAAISCLTLGRSFGAFIGGLLWKSFGGSMTFLIFGLINTSYTIVYAIISCVIQRNCSNPLPDDDRGKYQNPNNQTTRDIGKAVDMDTNMSESQANLDIAA